MRIENEFTVAAPVDRLWEHLLDVERIAPCMPGAEITEHVDDRNWKGRVHVRFGPVAMSFAGQVTMRERDDGAHRVELVARGTEQKGKGAANATVTSWLEPAGDETRVRMEADITLTGAAAQMSRGLLPEVSRKLTQQFAECLHASMEAEDTVSIQTVEVPDAAATETSPSAAPLPAGATSPRALGGIRLGLSAIWSVITSFFRRVFGGGRSSSA